MCAEDNGNVEQINGSEIQYKKMYTEWIILTKSGEWNQEDVVEKWNMFLV
jgi:hypothetical protein